MDFPMSGFTKQHCETSTGPKLESRVKHNGGLCCRTTMCFHQQRGRFTTLRLEVNIAGRVVEAIGSFTIGRWKFNQLRLADVSIIHLQKNKRLSIKGSTSP